MPKKKKATEMTTDELAKRLFPPDAKKILGKLTGKKK